MPLDIFDANAILVDIDRRERTKVHLKYPAHPCHADRDRMRELRECETEKRSGCMASGNHGPNVSAGRP